MPQHSFPVVWALLNTSIRSSRKRDLADETRNNKQGYQWSTHRTCFNNKIDCIELDVCQAIRSRGNWAVVGVFNKCAESWGFIYKLMSYWRRVNYCGHCFSKFIQLPSNFSPCTVCTLYNIVTQNICVCFCKLQGVTQLQWCRRRRKYLQDANENCVQSIYISTTHICGASII